MERMLSQQLSKRFISWCNYEYMLPTRFFAHVALQLGLESGSEAYQREKICWRLEEMLRNLSGETFAPLQNYVNGAGSDLKRYQLAAQLAYLFDQYQIMRLQMIEGWQQNRLLTKKKKDSEKYQMELWNLLQEDIGHSRHRGMALRELILYLEQTADCSRQLPNRISVFGLHSMPPLFLGCLQALAIHCDVHFYLLSPCKKYWADQVGEKISLRQEGKSGSGHPLLRSLGQQGREFQNMLQGVAVAAEFTSFENPSSSCTEAYSLLQQIQADLLDGKVSTATACAKKDDSLEVISVHSPHRELMVLRDRILFWLDKDEKLGLKDIIVMAPDIQVYAPLIDALFHDIPHSIADKNPAFANSAIATFLQFLRVCGGRFPWLEVVELLEREEIYPHFDIEEEDLSKIRHWVQHAGIRWGVSAKHKEEMGFSGQAECTWKAGVERLLMGYAVGGEEPVHNVFPYNEIEGAMAASLGGLSLFLDILAQAQVECSKERTLLGWSELFSQYIDKLFVKDASGRDKLAELYTILADLGREYGTIHKSPVSFAVICSWLERSVTQKRSSAGFLRGQLTFCSMLPMRSIPFKKVCLLGLNDTLFPQSDIRLPFDLLGERYEEGDRSRRGDDKYQFLEAILSARESLYISYVGQSIYTNDPLNPSVLVAELVELARSYGYNEVVEKHPLHGFSKKYFSRSSALFSYSSQLQRVAAAMDEAPSRKGRWWQGSVAGQDVSSVSVAELFSFYRHPQKFFIRNVLGIHLEAGITEQDPYEPFVLDSLQNYLVNQELVEEEDNAAAIAKKQASGRWPLGTPGTLQAKVKQEEQLFFRQRVHLLAAEYIEPHYVDITLQGIQITGMLTQLTRNGSFLYRYSNLKAKDIMSAWLQHCLLKVGLAKNVQTTLLCKDAELSFPTEAGGGADLEYLLSLYLLGCNRPSALFLEPLLAYVKEYEKKEKGGKGDPMGKACGVYKHLMKNGYEPEWELLYCQEDAKDVLNTDFEALCEWFYGAIWQYARVMRVE